ncbi:MAG: hypothetical protein LBP25_03820 [Tannerellaceae bacterium]|jgi:hypothetical protein|nr:hypothetical protein [Tannerellaceae bacterium]
MEYLILYVKYSDIKDVFAGDADSESMTGTDASAGVAEKQTSITLTKLMTGTATVDAVGAGLNIMTKSATIPNRNSIKPE